MRNRPTPAEAMAPYHSLERPSSYKVTARFTATQVTRLLAARADAAAEAQHGGDQVD